MLYLYENGLNQYLLINDPGNGNTVTTIGTYTDLNTAKTSFQNQIASLQQTTILSWNGAQTTDYTTNPPTITNS